MKKIPTDIWADVDVAQTVQALEEDAAICRKSGAVWPYSRACFPVSGITAMSVSDEGVQVCHAEIQSPDDGKWTPSGGYEGKNRRYETVCTITVGEAGLSIRADRVTVEASGDAVGLDSGALRKANIGQLLSKVLDALYAIEWNREIVRRFGDLHDFSDVPTYADIPVSFRGLAIPDRRGRSSIPDLFLHEIAVLYASDALQSGGNPRWQRIAETLRDRHDDVVRAHEFPTAPGEKFDYVSRLSTIKSWKRKAVDELQMGLSDGLPTPGLIKARPVVFSPEFETVRNALILGGTKGGVVQQIDL